jgi:hypothetical protein
MKFVSGILFTGKARGRTIVLIAQPPEGGGVKETAVSNPTVVARTSGAGPFCDEVLADPSVMHRDLRGRVRFCGYEIFGSAPFGQVDSALRDPATRNRRSWRIFLCWSLLEGTS